MKTALPPTLIERLRAEVIAFDEQLDSHLSRCVIRYRSNRGDHLIIALCSNYYWDRHDPQESVREMEIRKAFLAWYEPFEHLFSDSGDRLSKKVMELKGRLLECIDRRNTV